MKTNLTATFVEKVAPPARGQQDIYDGKESGLILRVSDSGRKTWCVFYRHQGRNRRLTLGTYPVLSLADARELARKHLRDAAYGEDPAGAKQEQRDADSFGDLADVYLERHAKKNKRTWPEDERIIERELKPAWANRKAGEITRRDVKSLLDGIVRRGSPIAANRTAALVSTIFNFGVEEEIVEANPAYRIPKEEERSRDRVLSDGEIRALWTALDAETFNVAAFFKLGLLTAQRRGEILGMAWKEVDLDAGWWTIPGERTKNKLAHRVPVTGEALKIIRQLRDEAACEVPFVFPGPRGKWVSNPQKWCKRVRLASQVNFKFHDLRRTAASHMAGAGVQRLVISKLLNHVERGITAVYERHSYDQEKRAALLKWDREVAKIVMSATVVKVVNINGQPVS